MLCAATGASAVGLSREHRPDLVLLDVMLPDGNGWQVCRRLREESEEPAVVFLTARDASSDVTGGSGLGMSIVQAVVEAHGGTVRLRTAPGEGLAVTVTLPAERPVAAQARGEASSTTVMSGGAPTRTGGPQNPAPRVT